MKNSELCWKCSYDLAAEALWRRTWASMAPCWQQADHGEQFCAHVIKQVSDFKNMSSVVQVVRRILSSRRQH